MKFLVLPDRDFAACRSLYLLSRFAGSHDFAAHSPIDIAACSLLVKITVRTRHSLRKPSNLHFRPMFWVKYSKDNKCHVQVNSRTPTFKTTLLAL